MLELIATIIEIVRNNDDDDECVDEIRLLLEEWKSEIIETESY